MEYKKELKEMHKASAWDQLMKQKYVPFNYHSKSPFSREEIAEREERMRLERSNPFR